MSNIVKNKYVDLAVIILRIFLGVWFVHHGITKFLFKPETWIYLGNAMSVFGINSFPQFWGFMAVMSFVLGGAMLALGIYPRLAALFLSFVMLVAFLMHISQGDPIMQKSLLFLILLILIIITEGGSYRVIRTK